MSYDDESSREWLAPVYRDLPDEQIHEIVRSVLGEDVVLEDVEDIWGTLGQVASAVLPILGTALGAVAGGPVGAAAGGALGGAAGGAISSATSKSGSQPSQPASPHAATPPPAAHAPKSTPRKTLATPRSGRKVRRPRTPAVPGATTPQGVAAAAQLLSILFRPEVLQALMAMVLGSAGRYEVSVGGTDVPLGAFTNLIGTLANQASTDYNAVAPTSGPDVPEYLTEADGALKCDVAVPEERAGVLLGLLQAEAIPVEDAGITAAQEWWNELLFQHAMDDELEMAEFAAVADMNVDEGDNWGSAW